MTVSKYVTGFILSLLLTLAAYALVVGGSTHPWLLLILGVLAILQMIVQLVFFLHLGDEARPRQKLWSFIFMVIVLLILVVGSIWIMYNMNYNMNHMTSEEKELYMLEEYDKGF